MATVDDIVAGGLYRWTTWQRSFNIPGQTFRQWLERRFPTASSASIDAALRRLDQARDAGDEYMTRLQRERFTAGLRGPGERVDRSDRPELLTLGTIPRGAQIATRGQFQTTVEVSYRGTYVDASGATRDFDRTMYVVLNSDSIYDPKTLERRLREVFRQRQNAPRDGSPPVVRGGEISLDTVDYEVFSIWRR